MPDTKNKNKRLLGAICLAITVILYLLGLWPLNFEPANKATWAPEGRGLQFSERSMAYSQGRLDFSRALDSRAPQLTIEIWARPDTEATHTVDRLLSLSDDAGEWLTVGQWKSHLIIRSGRQTQEKSRTYRETGQRNALTKGSDAFITVTYAQKGTSIYTNGNLMKALPGYALVPPLSLRPTRVILGNGPSGNPYWNGTLYGLALYARELSEDEVFRNYRAWQETASPAVATQSALLLLYSFTQGRGDPAKDLSGHGLDLVVPHSFIPLQRTVLAAPHTNSLGTRSFWNDVAVNVAGFIPFGFFFSAFLTTASSGKRWVAYVAATVLGALVSLSIELVQVYLPTRDSSLSDVLANVTGTVTGILAYARLGTRLPPLAR